MDQESRSNKVEAFIARPHRAVWELAVPVMFGMAVQTVYSIVDMVFIGWLGGEAIAALTFNMPLVFFSIGITFGLGTGGTSVIARFLGAGDKRSADNTAEHALLIGTAVGLIVLAVGLIFKRPIFRLLGASGEVFDLAVSYFRIIVLGFVFTALNVQFRSIMTGEGDTRTPIFFQVGGTLLNLILDPLLIFSAGLGVAGAAWGTLASQFAVFLAFSYYFFVRKGTYLRLEPSDFSFSGTLVKQILKIGIPASLSMIIMSVGGMFFNRLIVLFGSAAVAAYGLGGRLDSIYFLPTMALASSMVTLTGMFYGAGRIDLVRKTLVYTVVRGEIVAFSFGAFFYLAAPWIFRIFTQDEAIIGMAVEYIRIVVFAFPFITIGMIGGRVFQGLGEGLPGLLLTSLRVVLVSVPLAYLFVYSFGMGLASIWTAMFLSSFFTSLIAAAWIIRRLKHLERTLSRTRPSSP